MIPDSIQVLYEDKDILVVNKPSGLVVHSDGRTDEPTLVDWLLERYPEIKGVGELARVDSRIKIQDSRGGEAERNSVPIPESKIPARTEAVHSGGLNHESNVDRSGIVHRLDRETSGALVVAKNQKAFLFLKKQFQDREVEKTYHAFVYGEMKQDDGVVDRPIARSKSNPVLWSATRGMKGKEREAVTEYEVLARHEGLSFVEVKPKTGRTHQIRVHMKAINHPIVCDRLYSPKRACALGFARLALHAFSIKFTPPSGKEIKVEAPYPADFQKAKEVFENQN